MTIYTQDIMDIVRLPCRDPLSTCPTPVLVTFSRQHIREGLLCKKKRLALNDRFNKIFINPDETPDVRKRKAFYRRVAFLAKPDSKEVTYRHNWISINDCVYRAEEMDKIPTQYCPKDFTKDDLSTTTYVGSGSRPKTYPQAQDTSKRLATVTKVQAEPAKPPCNEKIRLTKSGLLFSGPITFPSNLSPAEFVFDKTPYNSTRISASLRDTPT